MPQVLVRTWIVRDIDHSSLNEAHPIITDLQEFGNPHLDPPWGDSQEERANFLQRLRDHMQGSMNSFMVAERARFNNLSPTRNPYTGDFEVDENYQAEEQQIPESVAKREDLNEFFKRSQGRAREKRIPTRYERKPVI